MWISAVQPVRVCWWRVEPGLVVLGMLPFFFSASSTRYVHSPDFFIHLPLVETSERKPVLRTLSSRGAVWTLL